MDGSWVKPGQIFAKEQIEGIRLIETFSDEDDDLRLYHVTLKAGKTLLVLAPDLDKGKYRPFEESITIGGTMHAVDLVDKGPCWCPVGEWPDQKQRTMFEVTGTGMSDLNSAEEKAASGGGGR